MMTCTQCMAVYQETDPDGLWLAMDWVLIMLAAVHRYEEGCFLIEAFLQRRNTLRQQSVSKENQDLDDLGNKQHGGQVHWSVCTTHFCSGCISFMNPLPNSVLLLLDSHVSQNMLGAGAFLACKPMNTLEIFLCRGHHEMAVLGFSKRVNCCNCLWHMGPQA